MGEPKIATIFRLTHDLPLALNAGRMNFPNLCRAHSCPAEPDTISLLTNSHPRALNAGRIMGESEGGWRP